VVLHPLIEEPEMTDKSSDGPAVEPSAQEFAE
jgi:hypothetical protein